MIIALTGTPGTGKTSISDKLRESGYEVVDLNKIATDFGFIIGIDKKRNSNIVDIDKLNQHIKKKYGDKDLVLIEGHLSHLLRFVNKVLILRCHPEKLFKNLFSKGWKKQKIMENVEAEILDIILCESLETHGKNNVFEIDVSDKSIDETSSEIIKILANRFKNMKKYKIGNIDWSEEILKNF